MRAWRLPIAIIGVAILAWIGWTIVQVTRADELARTDPQAALRIDPDHPQALLRLARKQLDEKQYDAATATARHLLQVEPGQGDAFAVVALAAVARGDRNADALLKIGLQRAPRNLDLRTQAMVAALQRNDLAEGLQQLDAMLRLSPRRGTILFPAMAQQAVDPRFADALVAKLAQSPPWRGGFLAALGAKGTPDAVDHIHAGLQKRGSLSEVELRGWLDRKLSDGRWGEAYAHWIGTLNPRPEHVASVYNGGFELEPSDIGFDWRKVNSPGVFSTVEPTPGATGQRAAHIHFIGRPAASGDLREPLLLAPGDYTLSLRARGEFLHSEKGLEWTIACDKGAAIAALELAEGSFDWRRIETEFTVPANACPGQWLQLQNPAVSGSAQQVTGDLWIDDIAIRPR